ncbi:MAG: DUF4340 domain-containing protein [Ruminococcaceae bacterium]|nr:DUF4340 domain-containing protein [Oscillospiraceae bacterium]
MKINTKSKNFKIILFSVIGLIVLGAVVLVLTLTAPEEDGGDSEQTAAATEDPALLLQPETEGNISSILVENSQGSYTVIVGEKDNEKTYTLKGMENLDGSVLDTSTFSTLEKNLTDMKARSVIEENPADLTQYGLDKPQAKATITYENGSKFTLLVGNTVTSGSANYVMVEGKNTVYSYYTYNLNHVMTYDSMSFVNASVIPTIAQSDTADISKITVKRKDWEEPLILEAMPELPEDSTSIQVFAYTFTSPYDIYLDMNTGTDYLNALSGLTAEKAVVVNPTDEDYKKYGLDDPFCEVDELVGETIYRLYIGDAITEEVKDEETGVTNTKTVAYYAYSNKSAHAIYRVSAEKLIWASMGVADYFSRLFIMPYIYDVDTFTFKDADSDFSVKIDGDAEECTFYLDGKETDGAKFRSLYQFVVSCRGEELYTDEARGELLAEYTFKYEIDKEPDTVSMYASDDRKVIIAVNGKNIFKTKWNYRTRLSENAKAFVEGGEIIENY